MKFKILKSDLYKHISIAQKAISNKINIQTLENILFQAKGDELILSSTDMELSIETRVKCDVIEEGACLIKSTIIGNIINKMPQDEITITVKDDKVNIKSQNSVFDIQGQDAEEYPPLPDVEENSILTLDNTILTKAIRETLFATSTDETRLALTGVLFEIKDNKINFVGLDGYRMAVRTLDCNLDLDVSAIVPKRAFSELTKILDDNKTEIVVVEGHIVFINGNTKMYSSLISKNYIDYKKLLNSSYQTSVKVNRHDLINSLERAQLLTTGMSSSLTKLQIHDGVINISSNSEYGSLDEDVFASQEGEDLNIAFNTRYLLEGLKAINEDEVLLHLQNALSPMNIYPANEDDDYLYLVLPVRLSQ